MIWFYKGYTAYIHTCIYTYTYICSLGCILRIHKDKKVRRLHIMWSFQRNTWSASSYQLVRRFLSWLALFFMNLLNPFLNKCIPFAFTLTLSNDNSLNIILMKQFVVCHLKNAKQTHTHLYCTTSLPSLVLVLIPILLLLRIFFTWLPAEIILDLKVKRSKCL